MSALGSPVLINPNRAYWLSSISNDVIHSTIQTQEIDAGIARFSTVYVSDFLTTSTLNASSFTLTNLDLSEANISTLKTNNAFTSSLTWASDLSGGSGKVLITTDPSGVRVSGDPIVFGDLVYFTSTINLVPVSTIVDTDIFSQRGFFSTISSGSISTGNLRATNASISTLTVSTLTAGDISGFSPSDWSLYPTLNSSITFQPGFVLSNINNKLYFAGSEITDMSGGGQNWSAFPALQDVSMNNFSLRGLSTLQYQDGARLYSLTGNNLFYNGQQISYGQAGAASNWSLYPALQTVNMNGQGIGTTGNLNIVATSNINNIASDFTVTADQGLNLATAADITLTAQNGLKGRINMTANGGNNNGVFGEINMVANGATLGGVGTGGLITLTANTPLGTASNLTSAVKLSASGINSYAGAVPPIGSLAGYNFIYGTGGVNIASGLPSLFPNIPLTTYLYGTAGVTTESDFYVPNIYPYWNGVTTPPDLIIQGRYIVPNLAQVYVQLSNVKNIFMDAGATITNLRTLNMSNGTGVITDVSTINGVPFAQVLTQSNIVCSNLTATVSVNTQTVSTAALLVSSINGQIPGSGSGTTNNFSTLFTSSFQVSSISGVGGFPIHLNSFLRFNTPNAIDNIDVINLNAEQPNQLLINASTIILGGNNILTNSLSTVRHQVQQGLVSSLTAGTGTFNSSLTVSTVKAQGGLPIKFENLLEFVSNNGINNLETINLTPLSIPQMNINASTIALNAFNTTIGSLSTVNHSTSGLRFSTATCFMSNTAFNFPLFIEADHAGNTTNTSGVAIAVQGHNLGLGQVRNQIEFGARGNGENYIAASWPGQNLEELFIDATDVCFRDGSFSTIVNLDPYGLITNGGISAPTLLVSSINGNDARPAFTNNLMLSTMELYAASTTLMYWDSTTTSSNINSSGYDVVTGLNGTFKIGASFQFVSAGAADEVECFLLKNNAVISQAGGIVEVANNTELVTYFEVIEPLVNGDTIQVGCYTANNGVFVSTINGTVLQSPAVILTMYKVD